MRRTTRSFVPTSFSSLRVATSVPTTRPTCIVAYPCRLSGATRGLVPGAAGVSSLSGFADREHVLEVVVRTRNHVDGDELADPAGRGRARVGGRLDRGDVAPAHDGHVAGPDLLPAHDDHLRGLDHGVRGLDEGHETAGLDHSKCFTHLNSP